MTKKANKIKDIFNGEQIEVWGDDDLIFITIRQNGVTISILKEEWAELKKELLEMLKK
jgi:hypothetical protein